jgi:hypothetical protein
MLHFFEFLLSVAALAWPAAAHRTTGIFISDFLRFQRQAAPPAAVSAFVCWRQGTGLSLLQCQPAHLSRSWSKQLSFRSQRKSYFQAFRWFTTVMTKPCHWTLSRTSYIQLTPTFFSCLILIILSFVSIQRFFTFRILLFIRTIFGQKVYKLRCFSLCNFPLP